MTTDLLPLASLTDEELLRQVYLTKPTCSALELELALRLEIALDLERDQKEHGRRAPPITVDELHQRVEDLARRAARNTAPSSAQRLSTEDDGHND